MGSTTHKIKGAVNQGAGAVKQSVGQAVGNPNLEVEGAAQKLKGEVQEAVGKAKDAVKHRLLKPAELIDSINSRQRLARLPRC
jgi:uncharacterized protein YjbJ (UPF0337 family)